MLFLETAFSRVGVRRPKVLSGSGEEAAVSGSLKTVSRMLFQWTRRQKWGSGKEPCWRPGILPSGERLWAEGGAGCGSSKQSSGLVRQFVHRAARRDLPEPLPRAGPLGGQRHPGSAPSWRCHPRAAPQSRVSKPGLPANRGRHPGTAHARSACVTSGCPLPAQRGLTDVAGTLWPPKARAVTAWPFTGRCADSCPRQWGPS